MMEPQETEIFVAETLLEAPYTHSTGPSIGRFLTSLRDRGEIWGRRCDRCDRVIVPANDHCESCGSGLGAWVLVGPEGTVRGFTIVSAPMPLVGIEPPFAFVRVRLDGAGTDLVHLATEVGGLTRGMRVRAILSEERTGTISDIVRFAPSDRTVPTDLCAPGPVRRFAVPPGLEARPDAETAPRGAVEAVRAELRLPFRLSAGALATRFQAHIRAGEIYGNRCASCGRVFVPPVGSCARCFTRCEGWERLPDEGIVAAFVVVNVPFYGQEVAIPYVLAEVRLDGADSTFFHLVGTMRDGKLVPPEGGVRHGMRVRAAWRARDERHGFLNDDIDHFEGPA